MRTKFNIEQISAAVPKQVRKTAYNVQFSNKELFVMEKTTGIRELRVSDEGTYSMALHAARPLSRDVDFIVFSSQTPDVQIPGLSNKLAAALDINCGTVDLNTACNGFVQGLLVASSLPVNRVLLVFSEHMTSTQDRSHRNSLLFGDAAVAMIVDNCSHNEAEFTMYSDGARFTSVWQPDEYLLMDGEAMFDFAVNEVLGAIRKAILESEEPVIDHFVLHQSNQYILKHLQRKLNAKSMISNIDRYGNTSSVSIPLALVTEKPEGVILSAGYGAGLNWGTVVYRYKPDKVFYNEI